MGSVVRCSRCCACLRTGPSMTDTSISNAGLEPMFLSMKPSGPPEFSRPQLPSTVTTGRGRCNLTCSHEALAALSAPHAAVQAAMQVANAITESIICLIGMRVWVNAPSLGALFSALRIVIVVQRRFSNGPHTSVRLKPTCVRTRSVLAQHFHPGSQLQRQIS